MVRRLMATPRAGAELTHHEPRSHREPRNDIPAFVRLRGLRHPGGMTIREYRAQRAAPPAGRRAAPAPRAARPAPHAAAGLASARARSSARSCGSSISAGQADEVRRHRGGRALDRLVGHRLRDLDQRLDAAERLRQREELRRVRDRASRRGWRKLTMPQKPGPADVLTPGAAAQDLHHRARALAACAAIRRCSVRSPRCTRKQSNGPGTAPIAFWTKRTRSWSSGRARSPRRRRHRSGRRGTSSSSARRSRRRARAGAGSPAWRTCCRPRRARRRLRATTPAMSTTFSSGFVGVSTQTSVVSGRTARSSASRSVWSTRSYSSPQRVSTLSTSR